MTPEKGQLNIFFDKNSVTTNESQQILIIVNTAIGLANLDIVKKTERDERFESLKSSFYKHQNQKNENFKKEVIDSLINLDKIKDDFLYESIGKLRSRFKEKIDEPYFEEINSLFEEFYSRRSNQYRSVIDKLQKRFFIDQYDNRLFENRKFNLDEFNDWLNTESENRVSEIGMAKTEKSLEYEIKFLIIFGLQNHSLLKDITLLTFEYILALLNKPTKNNIQLTIPKLPSNLNKIIEGYDKVECNYNMKKGTMKLKLKKRK